MRPMILTQVIADPDWELTKERLKSCSVDEEGLARVCEQRPRDRMELPKDQWTATYGIYSSKCNCIEGLP